jgi:hypothetical protein
MVIMQRKNMTKLLAYQIYLDPNGREVFTQKIYGSMIEYKYADGEKIFVALQEQFLEKHTYVTHYNTPKWGEE